MTRSSKEAKIFILDSFPTMTNEYPSVVKQEPGVLVGGQPPETLPSRFHAAQKAIESMIFDMMLNAPSGSLASVIVTKTRKTRHHLKPLSTEEDDENNNKMPNLTELCYDKIQRDGEAMRKPTAEMIQELWTVEPYNSMEYATANMQGDICDALVLAADAIHQMTFNHKTKKPYKFDRKIYMLTDAGHPVVLDMDQILHIIDSLRYMECQFHVLGMDFELPTVEYKEALDATSSTIKQEEGEEQEPNKRIKRDPDADADMMDDNVEEDMVQPDVIPSEDPQFVTYDEIEDREKLLASIAEKTGGSVNSIVSMQELLDAKAGKRKKNTTMNNFFLHVGPGLTVPVKKIKLMTKAAAPTIKQRILGTEDQDGKLEGVKRYSEWWYRKPKEEGDNDNDGDDDDGGQNEQKLGGQGYVNVQEDEIASAIRYGRDLVPLGEIDKEGLKAFDPSCGYEDETYDPTVANVHIVGYANKKDVHHRYLIGPPHIFFGATSKKSCTVIAALARTLKTVEMAAICTFKATKNSKPAMAVLYDFEEAHHKNSPSRLILFQLPYDEDIKKFHFSNFVEILEGTEDDEDQEEAAVDERAAKQKACDDLVDAMMLPNDALRSEKIPSPFHTSFNKTMLQRSVRGEQAGLVKVRGDVWDEMRCPPSVLEKARPALTEFRSALPLRKKKIKPTAGKGRAKKGMSTYADHLESHQEK